MKPEDLHALIEMAQRDNDEAARRLGKVSAQGADLQKRLETLIKYRADYRAQFEVALQGGVHAAGWHNFQRFIGRLDQAIAEQQAQLEAARQLIVQHQVALQAEQRRLKSFDTLQRRALDALAQRENRREQRATDEHAARAFERSQGEA